MQIRQVGPAACRSYIVSDEASKEAILVDPLAEDVDRVLADLDRRGLRLTRVVDTHTHADHLSGAGAIAAKLGIPYAAHASSAVPAVTERLADGATIPLGAERVQVIHTPGHTPDSISLAAGRALLTGDFLFLAQDGAGRLDLPGSDPGAHWDSLQRLASLPGDRVVLPGHDYQDIDESTLDVERRRNPRFQHVSRDEYVAWQRAIAAPTPDWMLAVIAANLGKRPHDDARHAIANAGACPTGIAGPVGACSAGPMAAVPTMLPAEAARRLAAPGGARPFLLDVREPFEFSGPMGRHAPGAHLVPLQQVPSRLAELPADPEAEVLVICKSGGRSARATAFLIDQGRRRVFNVAGGTDAWVAAGLPVER